MYVNSRVVVHPITGSGVHPIQGYILDENENAVTIEHIGATSYTVSVVPWGTIGRIEYRGPGLTPEQAWAAQDALEIAIGVSR